MVIEYKNIKKLRLSPFQDIHRKGMCGHILFRRIHWICGKQKPKHRKHWIEIKWSNGWFNLLIKKTCFNICFWQFIEHLQHGFHFVCDTNERTNQNMFLQWSLFELCSVWFYLKGLNKMKTFLVLACVILCLISYHLLILYIHAKFQVFKSDFMIEALTVILFAVICALCIVLFLKV